MAMITFYRKSSQGDPLAARNPRLSVCRQCRSLDNFISQQRRNTQGKVSLDFYLKLTAK
jgi:hypothetical protein